jgi:electron transport complex protein RnfA
MSALLLILLSAVLVNVVVIEHVAAWRPFVGVVDTFRSATSMGLMILIALPLTTALTYALSHGVLAPLGIGYLRTMVFFVVVIAVTSLAELAVRRVTGLLAARPGFSVLVMTNCALPGVALVADERARGFRDALFLATISGVAFAGLLVAFAALYERSRQADVPGVFRNAPLALITIGIVALGFMGFIGIVTE